jgi:hypothetical protein
MSFVTTFLTGWQASGLDDLIAVMIIFRLLRHVTGEASGWVVTRSPQTWRTPRPRLQTEIGAFPESAPLTSRQAPQPKGALIAWPEPSRLAARADAQADTQKWACTTSGAGT